MAEGLRAFDLGYPSLLSSKPTKCYNHKMRDSRFLKMDDSLIAVAELAFNTLLVCSDAVIGLVSPSSELLDSEEEYCGFWGGEGEVPYPLGDFSPTTQLDCDLMGGDSCEGIDTTLEVTPWKVKGRRELLKL